ncbi:MAG: putative membrane protein [Pseudohongiellaceae bacterium]|jgi:putative membrane protein
MVKMMSATSVPLLAVQTGHQSGGWSDGVPVWLSHLSELAPWLLTGLWLFVVGRAYLRRDRYRAVDVLSAADRSLVSSAIRRAEERTVGEIVPVVLERSDGHPGANWLAAFVSTILGSVLLAPVLPWNSPALVIVLQTLLGVMGWLVASRLADVSGLFVSDRRADEVTGEQALQEFYTLGLQKTEAATGVLLFVSLAEHRVLVLGDTGINAVMGDENWSGVVNHVLEGVAKGDLAGGLVAAIDELGTVLAEEFPWKEGDRNELPDRLIVRQQ